ncbi:hypothetical protein M9434_000057 [Picochlorum sp. BPE23]|nr:hypothetical protein M9434_000057 [Picochlorum sp. BPE23]
MQGLVLFLTSVLLLQHAGIHGVRGQRNSYLDLWKNVFDELPEDIVDEAVVNVESSILSSSQSDDGQSSSADLWSSLDLDSSGRVIHTPPTKEQLHGQQQGGGGGSRLMQYLEKRRERREQLYAAKHGMLSGNIPGVLQNILRDGNVRDRINARQDSNTSSVLRQLIRQSDSQSPAPHPPRLMKFRQLGIPVPDKTQFEKVVCFRMQNFGNEDGYYGASSSGPGGSCSMDHASQRAFMAWKEESFFTIDCSPISSLDDQEESRNASSSSMTYLQPDDESSGMAHMRAMSHRIKPGLSCILSIASSTPGSTPSHGSGAIIKTTVHRDNLMPLDAIGLRLCNVKSQAQVPAGETLEVTLESIKLNGKSLTGEHLSQPQKHVTEDGCQEHLLRVPTVSLADTFVLTAALQYKKTNRFASFDPGEASSIDVSIGHAHLV